MKSGVFNRGFTIIEVMIVMAVTSVLLAAAIITISGQQQKTEFTQAIRDTESQIKDIINDVADGYYTNTNNFSCSSTGSGPILTSGTNSQGANKGCIFMGRVIQFGVSGTGSSGFNIYTLVGQRQITTANGARDVTTLPEAVPTAIAPGVSPVPGFPDATDAKTLTYGLKVKSMYYNTTEEVGAVAFVSSLAVVNSSNQLQSGSQVVNLMPVPNTKLDMTAPETVDKINLLQDSNLVNPSGGVTLCFDSAGTDQSGVITIGSNGRQLSTNLVINSGQCQ